MERSDRRQASHVGRDPSVGAQTFTREVYERRRPIDAGDPTAANVEMFTDWTPRSAAGVENIAPTRSQGRQELLQPRPLDEPPFARLDARGGILVIGSSDVACRRALQEHPSRPLEYTSRNTAGGVVIWSELARSDDAASDNVARDT